MAIFLLGLLLFLKILSFLIILRVLMSWFAPGSVGGLGRLIIDLTEPILGPLRRRIPSGQGALSMIDWSPLIALFIIDFLRYFLVMFLQ